MDSAPACPTGPWTSRLYETIHDFAQMQTLLIEGRSRTDDWRYPHIGELIFWFWMVDCHLNPQEHIRLWHDSAGKLIAYAILGDDPAFDCQILPEYTWAGIEAEALAWAETLVAELRRRNPQPWGGPLVSGARQDDARLIAFLEQHGFKYRGMFPEVNMLRSLSEPIPEVALPAGYQVRSVAATGETSQRAAAQRAVWLPWSVGDVGDDDYARFMQLPGYRRDLDIVAVAPDGVIASYVNGWIDPVNRVGDFGPVGALPAYRRKGLTRAVMFAGLRRMKSLGMERVVVSTGFTNAPAQSLYESVGFRIVNKFLDYEKQEVPS
ncbi:MAG: GNAT family N-acetyltransferase [Anaerolineae bacterium]|nr:GNAT family N-acetyltransferase [Anaerolineae bacterium]